MMLGFTWRMEVLAEEPSAFSKSIPPSSAVGFASLVDASMSGVEEASLDSKELECDAEAAGVDGIFPSELSCSTSNGEESCLRVGNRADSATCWSEIWMP